MGTASSSQKLIGLIATLICVAGCSASPDEAASNVAAKTQPLSATSVTQSGDELRTSWYPNQPLLSPSVVSSSAFGQLFSTPVDGAVYAQPLVDAGTLFVATQNNSVYGLDPETGAVRWTRNFGTAFRSADINCDNVSPTIGITGTPVIDAATHVGYFFVKRYASGNAGPLAFQAHAVDVRTGAEQPGFPVTIAGVAANDATLAFTPRSLHQRPGLLLMNGVVYAAFGSHCDFTPYAGWIVGVSTSGQLTTLWSTVAGSNRTDGAGIWQSGSALASDGPGQILFATGNGGTPIGPIAGHSPPQNLGESVVRVGVQPDGTLSATDFFAPYDATTLDSWDADLSGGGPVGLPSPYFGTLQYPHLAVVAGKQGYVYLLDRDNLGGIANGPSGGDAVLGRLGPYGGVWSKAAVWPGNGGYVYLPTASNGPDPNGGGGRMRVFKYGLDGTGKPALSLVATSADIFGYSSSSPVVTSDQTKTGTALMWTVWAPDGTGDGAQLRAYEPLPANGAPVLRYSAPVGQSGKFVPPGIGDGRIYVGARDGHVRGFGAPTAAPLRASSLDLGVAVIGDTLQGTITVTANTAATVTSVTSTNPDFAAGAPTPALPASLAANATLSIPVTFTPTVAGLRAGTIALQVNGTQFEVGVSGQAQSANPQLVAAPGQVSFGGVASGSQLASGVTFTNIGGAPLTINRVVPPAAPFGVTGVPAPNTVLGGGGALTLTVTFNPTVVGPYVGSIALDTSAGTIEVPMSGSCALGGHLAVSPLNVDFGSVALGASPVASFTVSNTGGSTIQITRSAPPGAGVFRALTGLAEGTTLLPGDILTEYVSFVPTVRGRFTDNWSLNSDDGGGIKNVGFSGIVATKIHAGGGAVGDFAADAAFSGGTAYVSNTTVDTAGVLNAGPPALYQTERYGNFSYTLPSLIAGGVYTVRLHFAEVYYNAANLRLFNVSINGAPALTNFDVFAAAGAQSKAVVRDFNAFADANGQIVVGFVSVKDNAKLSGIELLGTGAPTSAPPTVAVAAAVTSSSINGTTTNASVLGADDGGEGALIYTWSTSGAAPGAVTFSPNASGTAKNTTVTFAAAGSYSLQALIRDADGSTVTSSVNVVVNQTLSGLSISPPSATLSTSATLQFSGTATDQFGTRLLSQPSVAWAVSGGGTISPSGLFTAGTSTGGPFTVSASAGSFSASASLTVAAGAPVALKIRAGGGAVSPFLADQNFSGGTVYGSNNTINVSGVTNAAPAAVYQNERYGNFNYAFPGLIAGGSYVVRLHFAEIYYNAANLRLFNVTVNGTSALTNFDVFATAGEKNKAVVRDINALASASGQIVVNFVSVKDSAKLSGIELLGSGTPQSAPPTVATAAQASPVVGTTATASVLGADDGGESALTYTWSVSGTAPGTVSFSPNASNAAKNTTLTFSAAGSYNLQVLIRDADGSTVASSVTVLVSQTLSGLSISPPSTTLTPSATRQFTATATDQFGASMTSQPSVVWAANGGGTISSSGLFSAGSSTGGPFTVSATTGSLSATGSVTIVAAAPVAIKIHAGGDALSPFVADQYFSGGATYASNNTINVSGVTNAAPAALYKTERYGNFSYTLPGLIASGIYTVRLHFAEIYYNAANLRLFNVTINGAPALTNFDVFAAATGQNKAVVRDLNAIADASGQIVIGFVSVKDSAKLSGLELLGSGAPVSAPPTVATAAAVTSGPVTGTTASVSVLGADDGGEAALTYTWSTSGAAPGTVSFSPNASNAAKNTALTFTAAGSYNLQALIRDADGSTVASSVTVVVNQTASGLSISPPFTTVVPSATLQFAAIATDQFGVSIANQPTVAWATTGGGTISASGLFTAGGTTGGPFTVSATTASLSASASVTVVAAAPVALKIHAGGDAVSPFVADQYFTGGAAYATNNTISIAGVANAAPAAVYKTERYGNFSYSLPGLIASGTYVVRLHFAEIYYNAANARLFNVTINGAPALSNFDVFASAGAQNKAVVRDLNAIADASGKIVVNFVSVKDSAKLSGIELLGSGAPVSAPPTVATPSTVTPSPVTGTTASASVLGADDGGEGALTYTWSTTGTAPGAVTFSPNASNAAKNTALSFTAAGSYSLQASIRDADGSIVTSSVSLVVSQTLTGLSISPASGTSVPSGTLQFAATATDQFGGAITPQPSTAWSVSGGGTISATGLFSAGTSTGGPFTVSASSGSLSASASLSIVAGAPVAIKVNAGGTAVSPFLADQFFSGGTTYASPNTVSVSGVTDAAPANVYKTERYGDFSYAVPGLTAGVSHTVRLHFAEVWQTAANLRLFNVTINGSPVLTNFDVYAVAGGQNKAVVRSFNAVPDPTGKIVVGFVSVKDSAKVSGIEVLSQ